MKTTTTGKRFSKIETTTVETVEDLLTFAKPLSRDDVIAKKTFVEDMAILFSDDPRRLAEVMEKIEQGELHSINFPQEPSFTELVAKIVDFARTLLRDTGSDATDYEPDSPEGLAEQIIECAKALGTSNGSDRDMQIFELGRLCTLSLVYGVVSDKNAGSAQGSRRRLWAEQLADDLVENNSGATFPELWTAIPEGENENERYDGREVYRGVKDGKVGVYASGAKDTDFLVKGAFRTGYITEAKKRHRAKSPAGKK